MAILQRIISMGSQDSCCMPVPFNFAIRSQGCFFTFQPLLLLICVPLLKNAEEAIAFESFFFLPFFPFLPTSSIVRFFLGNYEIIRYRRPSWDSLCLPLRVGYRAIDDLVPSLVGGTISLDRLELHQSPGIESIENDPIL